MWKKLRHILLKTRILILHLLNKRYIIFWLIFHIALGAVCTQTILPLLVWYYVVLAIGLYDYRNIKPHHHHKVILLLMIYLGTLELLCRMGKASPFIPYEISKYLFFCLLLLGIFSSGKTKSTGWIMLLLLLPSIFFDLSGNVSGYEPYVFNLLGPVNVALAIVYFSHKKLERYEYVSLIRLLVFTLVSSLIYTIIKTPDFADIEFALTANFSTSGGFGSNQVSSAFGVGVFILYISWIMKWQILRFLWLDILILVAFAFQGLMTFSRGGMVGAFLAVLVFLVMSIRFMHQQNRSRLLKLFFYTLISLVLLFFAYRYADNITNGMLTLRYEGHTAGTLEGTKEQTLNNITSNRFDIFAGDLELWWDNPFLGVGTGASQHLRTKVEGIIAHVELSRLMAEHGILGLIYFVLLLYVGYTIYRKANYSKNYYYYINLSLFVLAVFTTFHASMRTFITPLLISISLVSFVKFKKHGAMVTTDK